MAGTIVQVDTSFPFIIASSRVDEEAWSEYGDEHFATVDAAQRACDAEAALSGDILRFRPARVLLELS